MEQGKTESGPRSTAATIVVAFLAGLLVIFLLLPWYQLDSDPPQCFSMFDYRVPCGAGLAFAAGAAAAGLVGLALWLAYRRRNRPRSASIGRP